MKRQTHSIHLGIDGGGTKTIVMALDQSSVIKARQEYGPGNFRILGIEGTGRLLSQIAADFQNIDGLGVCLAGLREATDVNAIRKMAISIWPNTPIFVGHDLDAAFAATSERQSKCEATIIVLSGTGSCCHGKNKAGLVAKVGGWGHLLGDRGSGYAIGLRGLREVVSHFDRDELLTMLGQRILRHLQLNRPEDLISFAQGADKHQIAALAPEIFAAATEDPNVRSILDEAAESLASDALRCAGRLAGIKKKVRFVFAGGLLTGQPQFTREIGNLIRSHRPNSLFETIDREGAWGAARLGLASPKKVLREKAQSKKPISPYVPAFKPGASPTEQRNPRSVHLDTMSLNLAVELMLAEEGRVIPALLRWKSEIVRAIEIISTSLRNGGRLIYMGAGTSGRLGVLDASECPPTFRSEPEQVQGIIAGGQQALWRAVEGAEDDAEAGEAAVRIKNVGPKDVIVGIAASGRTPFVWGGLSHAKRAGAKTILLCFNPGLEISKFARPDIVITADLGPEVLTGSTRLKCGTATKLILNILTTLSMVKLGKVVSNLMVDMNPSNLKLRDRAIRILQELTGCNAKIACETLSQSRWVLKEAVRRLRKIE